MRSSVNDSDGGTGSAQLLQQELLLRSATVQGQGGFQESVPAINNLAFAPSWKEASNLVDVKGLGQPNEFSGKDGKWQQRSKKHIIIL